MKNRNSTLSSLCRIAKLRCNIQVEKLSTLRAAASASRSHIEHLQSSLDDLCQSPESFSLVDARRINAITIETAKSIAREGEGLRRILYACDIAHANALREFGRVKALNGLWGDYPAGSFSER